MSRDLDLRKLRYFSVLAEELHFGRAAERLHIAQPVLSRQIRALESQLHADLFTRDRRRVELTAAGRALGAEAPALLAAAEAARRRVGRAARGGSKLVVAFMPGLQVTQAVSALETAHPLVDVEVLRTGWDDQVDVLYDGRADVSFVRLPINARGLQVRDLGGEPRGVVLARNHPLAGAHGYRLTELADEHLLQSPGAVPEWGAVATEMLQGSRQSGPDDRLGVEEKLENVARGRGIAILPASVIVSYLRRDVWHAPILDIPPSRVAVAWGSGRRDALLREFIEIALTAGNPAAE